jgi:signal transduction histidine kinase
MVSPETAVCIAADGPALFRGVSFISGLLYLCGSVWFIRDFLSSRRRNDVSFIAVCLISAFACLIFPFTDMWSAEWWYLSLLRLAAFGVLLSSVLRGFKQMLVRQRQVEHELLSLVKFPNRNPNPVLRVGVDGEVLYANRASREILPYLCKQENRVTLPESFGLSFEDLLASGAVVRKELVQGEMAYALDLAPIEDEQVVNIYALDISDKHRAFLDLQRSNRDLEQFAYISSHDLQEPLRMVSNYVQLIERRYKDRLDQDANDFIAFAVDGVRRMSELIEGLLQFSRVQTQGHPLETVDCNRLLDTVFRDISVRIHECNAEITVDTLPTVRADRVQLSRIFQNLISNAMKFCDHPPPKIRVSGKELEDHWEFAVADNGIGIDPEYAHKIFGLFKRLHGREKYSGTGIGLAVCKRIIERHGGEIWVESREGGGSVFRFTIHKGGHDEQGSGN